MVALPGFNGVVTVCHLDFVSDFWFIPTLTLPGRGGKATN